MSVQFERVALIGIGLIGSSLAHIMRRAKLAAHTAGYAKNGETRTAARTTGLGDSPRGHRRTSAVAARTRCPSH